MPAQATRYALPLERIDGAVVGCALLAGRVSWLPTA